MLNVFEISYDNNKENICLHLLEYAKNHQPNFLKHKHNILVEYACQYGFVDVLQWLFDDMPKDLWQRAEKIFKR